MGFGRHLRLPPRTVICMKQSAFAFLLLSGALTACSGGGARAIPPKPSSVAPPVASSTPSRPPADWTTYHGDTARSGVASQVPAVAGLAVGWPAAPDGAVYGQPLGNGG